MKNFMWLILITGIVGGALVIADQKDLFIIKKPAQKKISVGALKDQCSDSLSQTLMLTPQTLKKIAEIQENGMGILQDMMHDTLFSAFNKTDIETCAADMTAFLERQETINNLLDQQVQFLKSIKKRQP